MVSWSEWVIRSCLDCHTEGSSTEKKETIYFNQENPQHYFTLFTRKLLERCLNIGKGSKTLSTQNPKSDDFLNLSHWLELFASR